MKKIQTLIISLFCSPFVFRILIGLYPYSHARYEKWLLYGYGLIAWTAAFIVWGIWSFYNKVKSENCQHKYHGLCNEQNFCQCYCHQRL